MKKVNVFELSYDELNGEMKELLNMKPSWGEEERNRLWELAVAAVVLMVKQLGGSRSWDPKVFGEAEKHVLRRLLKETVTNPMALVTTEVRKAQTEVLRYYHNLREIADGGDYSSLKDDGREPEFRDSEAREGLREAVETRVGDGLKDCRHKVDMRRWGRALGELMVLYPKVGVAELMGVMLEYVDSKRRGVLMRKTIGSLPEDIKERVLRDLESAGAKESQLDELRQEERDSRIAVPLAKVLKGAR
jgi:hypothetical protein